MPDMAKLVRSIRMSLEESREYLEDLVVQIYDLGQSYAESYLECQALKQQK